MNKFWAGLAIVTLSITGILYARGFGESFSEHGDSFNRNDFIKNPDQSRPRPQERPQERHQERRDGDHRERNDFGRNPDYRSNWEKEENQGAFKNPSDVTVSHPVSVNRNQLATPAQVGSQVRQNFPNAGQWFTQGFYAEHGIYNTPAIDAWRAANWADAAGAIGAGWGTAISYDPNGSSVEISQPGSSSYTATGQDSYMNQPSTNQPNTNQPNQPNTNQANINQPNQTSTATAAPSIARTAINTPPAVAENTNANNWIPLGVFALGTDTVNPADTNLFVQLAVNKDGNLQGTFYNAKTNKIENLTGNVDLSNQLASFYIANRPDSPIISTGLYNLTQPQTPVNVIMSDSSTRTWDMVKINK